MNNMRTFRCDDDTWRKFKLVCTIENISMQNKLGELVIDYVKNRQVQFSGKTTADAKNGNISGHADL